MKKMEERPKYASAIKKKENKHKTNTCNKNKHTNELKDEI